MAAEDVEECRQPSAINLSTPRRTPERSEHSDTNVSTRHELSTPRRTPERSEHSDSDVSE